MMNRTNVGTRYGVEIKGPTVHVECEALDQVLALLEEHTGVVRVFDRHSQEVIADGAIHDARESLDAVAGRAQAMKQQGDLWVADGPEAVAAFHREVPEPQGPGEHSIDVPISGSLNIATAYYFGDLGAITRTRDRSGRETYFRSMISRERSEPETT